MNHHTHNPSSRQRGTVLILTTFIVLALAALVLVFAAEARTQMGSAANLQAQREAHFIAMGAIEYVMAEAQRKEGLPLTADDLDAQAVPFADGYFWLIKSDPRAEQGLAFGVLDEASKLSLNLVTREMLIKLPLMTDELADSMIDWRDGDAETLPAGAENDYYLSLDEAYYCKDAPYESIEEILLVRGGEGHLVFGEDANYNHLLDDNENDGETTEPFDNGDRALDRGLADFLTAYSSEPTGDSEGGALININNANPQGLEEMLHEELGVADAKNLANQISAARPYRNLIDFALRSGLEISQFEAIKNRITVNVAGMPGGGGGGGGGSPGGGDDAAPSRRIGRLNINTASETVLETLPGLDAADVDSLIATRSTLDLTDAPLGWVIEALEQEKAVILGDLITHRTFQYNVDVVAVNRTGRSFKRYRAVLDVADDPGRIVHFVDLTQFGWPLDEDVLAQIRAGELVAPVGSFVGGGVY